MYRTQTSTRPRNRENPVKLANASHRRSGSTIQAHPVPQEGSLGGNLAEDPSQICQDVFFESKQTFASLKLSLAVAKVTA